MAELVNVIGDKELTARSGVTTELVSPVTGAAHGSAPRSGPADVELACTAAADAFDSWSTSTPGRRQDALLRLAPLITDRADEFAAAETGDTGKVLDRPGTFHEATVVTGLRQDDEVVREEIFGPVFTVQSFVDEERGLRLANDSRFGLAAGVLTRDHGQAMRVSRALDAGIVWINTHGTTVSEMPHGGTRHSGYGSDLSIVGLLDYTRPKHVMSAWN